MTNGTQVKIIDGLEVHIFVNSSVSLVANLAN